MSGFVTKIYNTAKKGTKSKNDASAEEDFENDNGALDLISRVCEQGNFSLSSHTTCVRN